MVMRPRDRTPRAFGDPGFALVETLVSAVVLIVISLSTLAAIDRAQKTSAAGKGRSVAAALAEQDQERLRSLPVASLSNYGRYHTPTRTANVAGVPYTVASSVNWVRDATGGTQSCTSDATQAEYLQINSTVTSPRNVGTEIRPVTVTSLVAPPLTFAANKGTLAVQVLDGANNPVVGLTVGITGGVSMSDSTNSVGCAIFAYIPVGTYHARFSQAGWVDPSGTNAVDATKAVTAGNLSVLPLVYDRAGAMTVKFETQAVGTSTVTPSRGWSATAANTGVPGSGMRTTNPAALNAGIAINDLFPFRTAYNTFAGECASENPVNAVSSNYYTVAPGLGDAAIIPPGDTSTVTTVRLPALKLKVTNAGTGAVISGANVVLSPRDATCTVDPTMTTGTNGLATKPAYNFGAPAGNVTYDPGVPYGSYDICADAVTGSGSSGSGRSLRRYAQLSNVAVNSAAGKDAGTLAIPVTGTTGSVAGSC
jgi:Tfp pilus assembly protein PilV